MLDKSLKENLKRVDPDRYRASVFAPKLDREALLTIYAFHAELAKIPEIVSEPMIGAIRYQWWRDAIDEIYSDKPIRKHEVVTLLATLINSRQLPRFYFDKLIDGREKDLDPTPFENLTAAQNYCAETSGQLMLLAASTLSDDFDKDTILRLGETWGMTGLARSWRYYKGSMLSKLEFIQVLNATQAGYLSAKGELGKVSATIMPAIAYGALVPGFVTAMQKSGFDPLSQTPNYGRLAKQSQLMLTVLKGKV